MMYTSNFCYGETANNKCYVPDTTMSQNTTFLLSKGMMYFRSVIQMGLLISKPRIRQNFPLSHRQCWTWAWGGRASLWRRSLGEAHSQEDRWMWVLHSQFFQNFQAAKSLHLPWWRGAKSALKENLSSRKLGAEAVLESVAHWPLILPSTEQVLEVARRSGHRMVIGGGDLPWGAYLSALPLLWWQQETHGGRASWASASSPESLWVCLERMEQFRCSRRCGLTLQLEEVGSGDILIRHL